MSIVVKVGGNALHSLEPDAPVLRALALDLAALVAEGEMVVVVHGGGPQIAALLALSGHSGEFIDGLRVTSLEAVSYVAMALSQVNTALVAAFSAAGVPCVGVSGADAGLLRARPAGAPWGQIGLSPTVDATVLSALAGQGFLSVVSPIALDGNGHLLNCNADTVAGALAGALGAHTLVLLSDVDQLRSDPDDPESTLSRVVRSDVDEMIASGAAREGMRPKLSAALDALGGGASRVVLANGTRVHALRDVLTGATKTTEVLA